jgi:hypothetical protein
MLCAVVVLSTGCRQSAAPPAMPPASASAPVPDAGARFTDVASAAGIDYQWRIAGSRPLTILQTIGNGCAFLDYDNDGALDILLVGSPMALYHGDGHGHFTDVTAALGLDRLHGQFLGCATGDIDNDGYEDVYLSGYRTGALLRNVGGKAFQDVSGQAGLAPQPWGTACAFGDIDGDGKLDLYVGNYLKFDAQSRQLCDNGGHKTSCSPLYYPAEKGVLYRNLGAGRFQDVTKAWGALAVPGKALGAAFADYDGSGRRSLAIANDQEPGDLLRNDGGRFVDIGESSGVAYSDRGEAQSGMGIDWGDYDNDGKLDLVVATFQNEAKSLYQNKGQGVFVDRSFATGLAPQTLVNLAFAAKWLDYDNDGWLDLMLTNGHVADNVADYEPGHTYRQPTQLFHGEAGASFADVSVQAGPAMQKPIVGRGLAVGDYDNDGRVDALVVDSEGPPMLLHNESLNAGHWLSLSLAGVKSNRDAIGAIVTVEAAGVQQTRHCHTDGSYLSASDRRVHVGLGKATSATITVRWPSGQVNKFVDIPSDRRIALHEGASRFDVLVP